MDAQAKHTTAEADIRALVDDWLDAFGRKDVERIMRCYAADVRAFDAILALQFRGREAYGKHWAACMEMCPGDVVGELDQVEVETDGQLGFVHMLIRCGTVDENGTEESSWMRYTMCVRHSEGRWQIAHEHVSAPFDVETFKALFDLQP